MESYQNSLISFQLKSADLFGSYHTVHGGTVGVALFCQSVEELQLLANTDRLPAS